MIGILPNPRNPKARKAKKMATVQDIYMKRTAKAYGGDGHHIYAEVQFETAALDEPKAKMQFMHRHYIKETQRVVLYTFEFDLLFCREAGIVFVMDFYGDEMFVNDIFPQELRPHYVWVWKESYMRKLKSMLTAIVYKLYGLKCQFYNKGAFNVAKKTTEQLLLKKTTYFREQLPLHCLGHIAKHLIPNWFDCQHIPIAGRWKHLERTAFYRRRRIVMMEHKALSKMDEYTPTYPPENPAYTEKWEHTQMVFL